jgi:hypothetical protein
VAGGPFEVAPDIGFELEMLSGEVRVETPMVHGLYPGQGSVVVDLGPPRRMEMVRYAADNLKAPAAVHVPVVLLRVSKISQKAA